MAKEIISATVDTTTVGLVKELAVDQNRSFSQMVDILLKVGYMWHGVQNEPVAKVAQSIQSNETKSTSIEDMPGLNEDLGKVRGKKNNRYLEQRRNDKNKIK